MSYSSDSASPHRQSSSKMQLRDEKLEQRASNGLTAIALNFVTLPVRLLRRLLFRSLSLVVVLLCIPLLMFLSGAAGWTVWRNVPVDWKADAFLQYGEESTPFANMMLPRIFADQPYDISLHLVVPATESNYALGNFMATLKLTTAYNDSIIIVRRPVSAALVPPRSSLAKQFILGSPATSKVEVPLLSQFVSGVSMVRARLELGRSDAWRGVGNGQGRELSVVQATLKGRVRPRGVMAVLARYPRLTTFASTFMFFFVSLMVVCGVLLITFRANFSPHPPSHKGSSSSEDFGDDFHPRPRSDPTRHSRQRPDNDNSTSSSSTPDEDKSFPQNGGGGVRMSSLRKRRSTPILEPVGTARVKIEDIPTRRGTTPPPRPGGDSSSRQHSAAVDPVSPSDADVESQ